MLLVSILKALKFDAHIALVDSRETRKIDKYLPSPKVFDHAVVTAKVMGKDVWVDVTDSNQGGKGTEIYFPGYGKALVIKAGSSALTSITEGPKGKSKIVERFIVTDSDSPVVLEVESVYSREKADDMRAYFASESIDKIEKTYLDYYAGIYPKIKALDSLVLEDDLGNNVLTVIEKYEVSNFFSRDSINGTYTSGFYADYINDKLPKILPGRKHPIKLTFPFEVDYTCKVIMPGGWNIDSESKELRRDDFYFRSDYTEINDTLSLRYQFSYLNDFVPVQRLQAFASDSKLLKDKLLSYNIVYRPDTISFYPNYWMIAANVAFCIIFAFIACLIYRKPTATQYSRREPLPISGWLILVAIILIYHAYTFASSIYENKDFDLNHWEANSQRQNEGFYKFLVSYEAFSCTYVICFSLFCLFLLFKKRDIFPKITMIYLVTSSILVTGLHILINNFYGQGYSSFSGVTRSIISVIIWGLYFNTSTRVKKTFIVPYVAEGQLEEAEAESNLEEDGVQS